MPRPLSTPGKDPVPIVQETGWAPGPIWTQTKNLAPTGIFFYCSIKHFYYTSFVDDTWFYSELQRILDKKNL